jgi:hypothetical protein
MNENLLSKDNDELDPGQFYLNNNRLPRPGIDVGWTDEMVNDVVKCKKDITYFAENFFYITTSEFGKQMIKLYPPQRRILKSLGNHRFTIVCSSRQAGKTTLMTIFALWMTSFESDKRIVIVANKEKTAIMILRRIQTAYQKLPNWLKPGIKAWGSTEIIFENDSSISISTTTGSAARGESINVLIIDEMAHIEEHLIEDFWGSVIPTIASSRTTKIFAVSTPKGTGNKFYEIYTEAEAGTSTWHSEKIDWWEIPDHGKKWAKEMLDALGGDQQLFAQEFENVFLEVGESAINTEIIKHFKALCRNPEYVLEDGHYKIWKEPDPSHIYAIGVDVGEGIGKAASTAQILDFTDLTNIEQVAVFHDNMIDPRHFAEKLFKIACHWGKPPLLIERNNCGAEVVSIMKEVYNYEKLVAYGSYDKKSGRPILSESRPGIYSHTNSRYTGVGNMRYWLNSLRVVSVYDLATVHELETFVRYPNGTWGKRQGNNIYDDRVFGLIWSLFVLEEPIVQSYFDVVRYDDRGKPLVIRSMTIEEPEFFKLDNFFQKTEGAPLPAIIGFDRNPNGYSAEGLAMQGWNYLR